MGVAQNMSTEELSKLREAWVAARSDCKEAAKAIEDRKMELQEALKSADGSASRFVQNAVIAQGNLVVAEGRLEQVRHARRIEFDEQNGLRR